MVVFPKILHVIRFQNQSNVQMCFTLFKKISTCIKLFCLTYIWYKYILKYKLYKFCTSLCCNPNVMYKFVLSCFKCVCTCIKFYCMLTHLFVYYAMDLSNFLFIFSVLMGPPRVLSKKQLLINKVRSRAYREARRNDAEWKAKECQRRMVNYLKIIL